MSCFTFILQVYFLNKDEGGRERPFTKYFQAQVFCKTWDAPGLMSLPEGKDMVMPGEDATLAFTLRKLMVGYCTSHIVNGTDFRV